LVVALTVVCGLLTPLLAATATPASAQEADPVTQATDAVVQAQAEVDAVAGAYFDALQRAQQLDSQISNLQARIDESRQRVTELKRITKDRAVAAYKRSGNSLGSVFLDSSGAADTAHRIKLLDIVNAHDDDAVRILRRSQDDLTREHQDLEAAQKEQASALARLKDQDREVNAKLVAAQAQRQVALDQQLQAQQQAAAEAAAAAAAAAAAPPPTAPPAAPPATQPPPRPNNNPAPVPANSVPTSGVNPHHNDPYLTCVRHYESTDNYQAYNPGGPAYGAYQFLQSTWNLAANHAGRGDLVGLDPRRASQYDQDEMAWTTYQWQGKRPWSADPC
jgi:peptidoglycan hydrolase CwlO-like protein